MRRSMLALSACAALALLAGCGSSGSNSSSSSSSATSSSPSSTTSSAATGKTTGNGTGTTRTPTSALKTSSTTPKYASPPAGAPVQSGTVQIAYRNIAIDPDVLKVKVGTTIKWTNYDQVVHNVTSKDGPGQFTSKDFNQGGTFEFKTTKAGVIHYLCTIHPASMNGTITVVN